MESEEQTKEEGVDKDSSAQEVVDEVAKEEKAKSKEEEERELTDIPMIPNYLDLILGEVNAIRILLENKEK